MRYIDINRFTYCKTRGWDADAKCWSNELKSSNNPNETLKKIGNKWSNLKDNFITEFGDKCWYTEVVRVGTDFDVDHFWPKGRVKDQHGNILERNNMKHPGYWWKAYDINNYRYSCIFANRSRSDGGKVDYFPLSDETYRAWNENDDCECEYEYRLILDPCSLDDVNSISFEIQTGEIACAYIEEDNQTAYNRVKFSKTCLNLDEKTILNERLVTIKKVKNLLILLENIYKLNDPGIDSYIIEAKKELIVMCDRKSAFSGAVIQFVSPYRNESFLADICNQLDLNP